MLGVQADKTWMGPEMDGGIDNNKTTTINAELQDGLQSTGTH